MTRQDVFALAGALSLLTGAPALAGGGSDHTQSSGPDFSFRGLFFADTAGLDGYAGAGRDDVESELRLAELIAQIEAGNLTATIGYDFARDGAWRDAGVVYREGRFRFRFGQFKEPASMDKLGPQDGTLFLEGSRFVKAFAIGRRLGASVVYARDEFSLTGGIFDGSLDDNPAYGFGSGQIAYGVRATMSPIREEERRLHFGAYARHLDFDGEGVKIASVPHTVLASKTLGVSLTGGYSYPLAETSTLLGLEAGYSHGPFYVSGEAARYSVDTDSGEEMLSGGYLQASYALTGETRPYYYAKGAFNPVSPSSPVTQGGYGAWEIAARIDHLDLSGFSAGESTSYTLGLIWTPVDNVRVLANYVTERGDAPVGDSDIWALRLQFGF